MGFRTEDIIDEIFDMVKPQTPRIITFQEYLDCKQADIIITMLIDAKGFWDYDQRENNNGSDEDDDLEYGAKVSQDY